MIEFQCRPVDEHPSLLAYAQQIIKRTDSKVEVRYSFFFMLAIRAKFSGIFVHYGNLIRDSDKCNTVNGGRIFCVKGKLAFSRTRE